LARIIARAMRTKGQSVGSYSQLFSLLQHAVTLIAACAFAFVGGCVALAGVLALNAPRGWLARWADLRFPRDLMTWGAPPAYRSGAALEPLARRFVQLTGWLLLGGGLGLLVSSGALAWLAISVTRLSLGIIAGTWLSSAIMYFGFELGATLGHLAGTYAVTRVATGPTWADLRRRRVSDYRAGWLGWGPFALAGVAIAPLVAALFLPPSVQAGGFESALFPAWPVPVTSAVLVWALLIPTLSALLCRWLATSPRALTFADPQIARAADELRRATGISIVTSFTWMSCGITLMGVAFGAPFTLVASFSPAATPLLPLVVFGILILLSLLGMLALLFGISLSLLRGRLGGRLAHTRPSLEYVLSGK
jgi:hypothetical protein